MENYALCVIGTNTFLKNKTTAFGSMCRTFQNQNDIFETVADGILDFSESNPFGDP